MKIPPEPLDVPNTDSFDDETKDPLAPEFPLSPDTVPGRSAMDHVTATRSDEFVDDKLRDPLVAEYLVLSAACLLQQRGRRQALRVSAGRARANVTAVPVEMQPRHPEPNHRSAAGRVHLAPGRYHPNPRAGVRPRGRLLSLLDALPAGLSDQAAARASHKRRSCVSFHPNLYESGQLCLKILSTLDWRVPVEWSRAMGLANVLVSIQSVMAERPYWNTEQDYRESSFVAQHEMILVAA
ncbi:hypothetical protein MTO96_014647 [Rhipicephalus appendiculatus]